MDYWDFRDQFFCYFTKLGKTENFNYEYVKWLHNKQTSSVRNALPIILKKLDLSKKVLPLYQTELWQWLNKKTWLNLFVRFCFHVTFFLLLYFNRKRSLFTKGQLSYFFYLKWIIIVKITWLLMFLWQRNLNLLSWWFRQRDL